jgi:hypothetical protein
MQGDADRQIACYLGILPKFDGPSFRLAEYVCKRTSSHDLSTPRWRCYEQFSDKALRAGHSVFWHTVVMLQAWCSCCLRTLTGRSAVSQVYQHCKE